MWVPDRLVQYTMFSLSLLRVKDLFANMEGTESAGRVWEESCPLFTRTANSWGPELTVI